MNIRKLQNVDLTDKRVLMSVGFNVALDKKGDVREKYKITAAKESVEYVFTQKNAKCAFLTHLGRPNGKYDEKFSVRKIVDDIERILNVRVKFSETCVGTNVKKLFENLGKREVLLLENVRLHEEEMKNDPIFAKKLAEPFDVFVNEAFSVSHRAHASVLGIAKVLPSYAGIWLQKETENLSRVKESPEHPAVAIIGGAKIETKLPLITMFEEKYDHVLVGGRVAVEAQEKKMRFSSKVVLPEDYAKDHADIGERTIEQFQKIIAGAKTIVWNGPMGKFENPPFDRGTRALLEAIIASGAYSLIGGGESVQVVEEAGVMDKISFVSTGGGAMLSFLSGKELPALEALKE